jgi:hypothetical protein
MSTLLERKFRLLARLNEELDDHVWSVFGRYIKEEKILFNSPEAWRVDDNSLFFTGEDGCRGCYDSMTCTIPMEFFTDTEAAFKRLRAEKVEAERLRDQVNAKNSEMNMLHEMLNGRLPCSALECELVQFAEQQAAENEVLRQERDQLKAELERYSMNAGAADQFRREAFAMRQALGFDKYGDDIAPVDLLNALDSHDAEAIERAREYVTSIVEESDFAVDYDLALLEYGKKLRQRAKEVQS